MILAALARAAEAWPPRTPTLMAPAVTLVAQPYLGGVGIVSTELPTSLRLPVKDGAITLDNSKEGVWADAKTKGNIVKTIRALRLYILKQSANTTTKFLGPGSKAMSMVFTLKKFPSSLKALNVQLPHALPGLCEGLFLKTAKGKRVLSVQFGRGDMEEGALTTNATAVANTVRKSLDARLVSEITVDVDRLALPVWNRKLWDRGKQKLSVRSPRHSHPKRGSMAPPMGPPMKKARLT